MPVTRFLWYPERLNAAIAGSFLESIQVAAADARANAPTAEATAVAVPTGPTSGVLKATGRLGPIMEEGASPHEIEATHGVLRFANGDFVSGTVHHPGSPAQPYVSPAAARWAVGGFNATARVNLLGAGFR